MYIAYERHNQSYRYLIRASCTVDDRLTYTDIYDLGNDPTRFIHYIGSNGFYFDEEMEDAVNQSGLARSEDELEDLLWPWVRRDVRDAVQVFKNRSYKTRSRPLGRDEKEKIKKTIHPFDKRRAHFLKFGHMDQGAVETMPPVLFKSLLGCCRDEIEQRFLQQEYQLKARELKTYVYTVFDLQRFFKSFMAKQMPHVLDQKKVDIFFIEDVCRLNEDLFNISTSLHPYLKRYVIMFFDYLYADSTLLDDFAKAFMNRHRVYKPKPRNPVSQDMAMTLFKLSRTDLKTMTQKQLTRLYRKMARDVHPDTGGSKEKFVELNNAYQMLLEKIRS